MTITLRYFAALRELRGCSSETRTIQPGTTIGALYGTLFPADAPTVAFARNRAVVPADTVLADGDEVSFLPPLGGG